MDIRSGVTRLCKKYFDRIVRIPKIGLLPLVYQIVHYIGTYLYVKNLIKHSVAQLSSVSFERIAINLLAIESRMCMDQNEARDRLVLNNITRIQWDHRESLIVLSNYYYQSCQLYLSETTIKLSLFILLLFSLHLSFVYDTAEVVF